jgi:hypothetical protein
MNRALLLLVVFASSVVVAPSRVSQPDFRLQVVPAIVYKVDDPGGAGTSSFVFNTAVICSTDCENAIAFGGRHRPHLDAQRPPKRGTPNARWDHAWRRVDSHEAFATVALTFLRAQRIPHLVGAPRHSFPGFSPISA